LLRALIGTEAEFYQLDVEWDTDVPEFPGPGTYRIGVS